MCSNIEYKYKVYNHKDPSTFHDYDDDNRGFNFCDNCNIIYDTGCTHTAVYGCTDNLYNGHIIYKYVYNNNEYIGTPQFNNIDEWINEAPKIEILEWGCLRTSNKYHPYISTHKYTQSDDKNINCLLQPIFKLT